MRKKALVGTFLSTLICLLPTLARADAPGGSGDLAAPPPLTLRGTVTDEAGAPLGRSRVELHPLRSVYAWGRDLVEGRAWGEPAAVAFSGKDGRFVLEAPAGVYLAAVGAPGRVPMQWSPLVLLEPTVLPPVALAADAGARVTVLDAEDRGTPATVFVSGGGAEIWEGLARDGWKPRSRTATSGPDGHVDLPRADGETLRLVAVAPGYPPSRGTVASAAPARLRLRRGSVRTIEVRNADGTPAPEVLVRLGNAALPATLTEGDGRAELVYDPSGKPSDATLRLLTREGWRHDTELPPRTAADGPAVLVLEPAFRNHGQVVDAESRQPLAGALVWPGHDPGAWTFTDAAGRYDVAVLDSSRFWLQAEAVGYLPGAYRAEARDVAVRRALTLALRPAATMTGRVEDTAGRAVEGATLLAVPATGFERPRFFAGPDLGWTTSGADGSFRLTRLRAREEYQLRVAREGFVPARLTVTGLRPLAVRKDVKVVLERGHRVVGRVVDTEENPVRGGEVRLTSAARRRTWRMPDPKTTPTALIDVNGRFELAPIGSGTIDLVVRGPGFAATTVRGVRIPGGEGEVDLGTIVLEPGAAIRGRVVDAAGEPLADVGVVRIDEREARAAASRSLPPSLPAAAFTDSDGRFELADLRRGEKVHLLFRHDGYAPAWREGVEAPNDTPVAVTLVRAFRVTGRVVDAGGSGVAGAEVSIRGEGPMAGGNPSLRFSGGMTFGAETDADGGFEVAGVQPGAVQADAWAPGFVRTMRSDDLQVPEDGDLTDVVIVLVPGATLEGTVKDANGEPVAGARVAAESASSVTDADGRYRAEGVEVGVARVTVDHETYGRLQESMDVRAGVNELDFSYAAGFEVTGRVVDASGFAVEGARVELRQRDGSIQLYGMLTEEDGGFRLPSVVSGAYEVHVEKQGYAAVSLDPGVEVIDQPVLGLELELDAGTMVRGRILGLDFDETASVEVAARRAEGWVYGLVDYEGRYEIPHLGAGDWVVRASLEGGRRQAEARVEVTRGVGSVTADLDFGGVTLGGLVVHGEERLRGAMVSLQGLTVTAGRQVMTDHEGGFELRDLAPGSYRLQVTQARLGLNHSEEIEIREPREVVISIATARMRGRVTDATSGEPVGSALVSAERLATAALGEPEKTAAFMVALATEEDGTFVVPSLSAGRYRFRAHKEGFGTAEEVVEVQVGDDQGIDLALVPANGLALRVLLPSGRPPGYLYAALVDASGTVAMAETRKVGDDGRAVFPSAPAGEWNLVVRAPGAATTWTRATVPSEEPLELWSEAAARLTVRVPELTAGNLVGELTLVDESGRPFEQVDDYGALRRSWTVDAGRVTVEGLPPGSWSVRVRDAEGRSWTASVIALPGQANEARLE